MQLSARRAGHRRVPEVLHHAGPARQLALGEQEGGGGDVREVHGLEHLVLVRAAEGLELLDDGAHPLAALAGLAEQGVDVVQRLLEADALLELTAVGGRDAVRGDDLLHVVHVALQRGEVAEDEGQRIVDLVGHAGGDLADRGQLLALGELGRHPPVALGVSEADEVADPGHEGAALDGLVQVLVGARLEALQLAVGVVELGGEEHHRHARAGRVLADATADLEPVHVGHADVEQDQVHPALLHLLEGLGAAVRAEHAEPFGLQVRLDEPHVRRLVVHHQHLGRLLVPVWALVVTPLQHWGEDRVRDLVTASGTPGLRRRSGAPTSPLRPPHPTPVPRDRNRTIGRQRGLEDQPCAGHRMGEREPGGVQGVAGEAEACPGLGLQAALAEAIEVAGVGAVHLVAHEREAGLAGVDADLVLAPGLGEAAQHGERRAVADEAALDREAGARGLPGAGVDADRDPHRGGALGDGRVHLESVRRVALDDGEVLLVDLSGLEGAHQGPGGLGTAAAHEQPGGLAVQPVRGVRPEARAVPRSSSFTSVLWW